MRAPCTLLLPLVAAGFLGCQDSSSTENEMSRVSLDLTRSAGWPITSESPPTDAPADAPVASIVSGFSRRAIAGRIAHYSARIRLGTGPYDVIGLHRVVKEEKPNVPVRTRHSIILDHGDWSSFVAAFMSSTVDPDLPDERSLVVFLAEKDVDVWGIDHAWSLVPLEERDFAFMRDWGIPKDVEHLRGAIALARLVRLATGNGWQQTTLLGWSTGAVRSFAYADKETQLPAGRRQVKGVIPIDQYFKTDSPELRQFNCAQAQHYRELIDAGTYPDETGQLARMLARLARTEPDAPSAIVPDVTNRQAALMLAANTEQFGASVAPRFHLHAGVLDPQGLPVDLRYLAPASWFTFLENWVPYMPNLILVDEYAVACDQQDVTFDDHLAQITVPVFYIGAGGGYGDTGIHSTTLVGSSDVSTLIVSTDKDRAVDFGHADLFFAENARTLVWQPIFDWLLSH